MKMSRIDPTALGLILILLAGCGSAPPPAPAPAGAAAPRQVELDSSALQGGQVTLAAARLGRLPEVLQVTGKVGLDENRTSSVGAVVEGRIVSVLANVGDLVQRGQRLARIRSLVVHVTRAAYAKAQAELEQREAELEFARNQRDRLRRLLELKAASPEQVQRAETDTAMAEKAIVMIRTELDRLEEELQHLGLSAAGAIEEYGRAGAGRKEAGDDAELVSVLSPIGGTVLERRVGPGSVVTPAVDLFVIADLASVWVHAQVPEKYLARLRTGQAAEISVQAYRGEIFPARISYIGDTLDPVTRTVPVRCQTENSHRRLKPEMYATIRVALGETEALLLIPAEAVQDLDGVSTVFVREGGASRFRPCGVQLGRRTETEVEVLSGLTAGQEVAARGSFLVKSEFLKSQMADE
jgi:membrane fusion protein, heavy metal efflux system